MSLNFKQEWKKSHIIKEQIDMENIDDVPQDTSGIDTIEGSDVVKSDMEGGPEAGEESEVTPVAEAYAKKLESLNKKKTTLEEEITKLISEIEHTTAVGQKKHEYEEARNNVSQIKEELDEMKNGDKLKGGLADDMDNSDIADLHDVPDEDIDKQVEIGKDVESEHIDDEKSQEEIAQDHTVEDPEYYDDKDGLDLKDLEDEAEKEKMAEGKKKEDPLKKKAKEIKAANRQSEIDSKKEHGDKVSRNAAGPMEKDKKGKARDRRREGKKQSKEQIDESKQKFLKKAWNNVSKTTDDSDKFIFHMG